MNKILVPTDFSMTARNAIGFALKLAMQSNCELLVFHAIDPDSGMIEEDVLKQFDFLKKDLDLGFKKKVKIEYLYEPGKLKDIFSKVAKKYKADLILIGTNGAGKAFNYTFGSNAYSLVENSKIPVIVVPPEAAFDGINRLVLALDFEQDFSEIPLLPLLKVSKILGGEVMILSVINQEEKNMPEVKLNIKKMGTILKDIPLSFHYVYRKDVEKAINDFARMYFADMIMLFPRKLSWFKKLFNRSYTRNMVYQVKTPLITLQN